MTSILFNRADFPADRPDFLPLALDSTWHQIEVTGEFGTGMKNRTQVVDEVALAAITLAFAEAKAAPARPSRPARPVSCW